MNRLVAEKQDELARLCAKHRVARLELFGSAAREGFDATTSDLDFLVEFQPMSPVEHADCYFGLQADLERLFGRAVDLVELSAVHNPYFLQAIEASRTVVYAAA